MGGEGEEVSGDFFVAEFERSLVTLAVTSSQNYSEFVSDLCGYIGIGGTRLRLFGSAACPPTFILVEN